MGAEGDAERAERLAVHAVAVRRGHHVRAGLVHRRVDDERGAVHGPAAVDHVAVVVHEDEVAHADVTEAHREGVHPEVLRELRVADGDVAGDAFAEPDATEDAQCTGELLLAQEALLLHRGGRLGQLRG